MVVRFLFICSLSTGHSLYSVLARGATLTTLSVYSYYSVKYWCGGAALLAKLGFCGRDCAGFGKCAAWFHDVGFSELYNGHEEVSINLVNEFLKKEDYSSEEIKEVSQCIEAPKMPQNPETELAKVLCDADLFHVGHPISFIESNCFVKSGEMNSASTIQKWSGINSILNSYKITCTNPIMEELLWQRDKKPIFKK